MRSIHIFFKNASYEELADWLTLNCKYQSPDAPWLIVEEDDPVIYIRLDTGAEYMAKAVEYGCAEETLGIQAAFGAPPTLVLAADVSGRHDGAPEVQWFVKALLSEHEGRAQDEYTAHLWTYSEIADSSKHSGHPFFDFKGWYREERGK